MAALAQERLAHPRRRQHHTQWPRVRAGALLHFSAERKNLLGDMLFGISDGNGSG
jgi:hypothetical protein